MKYLKVIPDGNTDTDKLQEVLLNIKGVKVVETVDEENPESELKKAFNKSKEQLKKGEYENIVNDIFDILINPKTK
ncbi:hypothetical protein H1R16_02195 [Marnyiella aurantia]|uniref:Uncharacterized protein n=1 Tax=Marnyiella aurantia TaxID=2758037 RepID=A0A7D7QL57_9FLAO|nr:DUF4252 domain-containing protein [Marnyiella aurantia]MBA5245751.1 hypothetical protein [Marnyiella aurantia]QMS98845.1 hypothetical protein H1R16_02195 [Marnyiella aurantia]